MDRCGEAIKFALGRCLYLFNTIVGGCVSLKPSYNLVCNTIYPIEHGLLH